jgi:hypothetical protein
MRKKEQFSEDFKAIERRLLKGDIEKTEAQIQMIALIAEVLLDLRTNLCNISNSLPNAKLNTVTP